MKSLFKVFFVLFMFGAIVSLPFSLNALDDFGLPPPDADEDLLPPPPSGVEELGQDLPPPPGEELEEDLPPPPVEEMAIGEELPPPYEEDEELPLSEEELAPPPSKAKKSTKVTSKTSKLNKYTVVRGDSLWKISGKSQIYNDSFQWPLLFKANRDIIEDPDLIYPRQRLTVKRNYTQAEIDDAIQKAKETPPYEPHTRPRKKLPIKY